jgi:integrase
MANLSRKGDVFVIRFRYQQKEYKKSLKIRDPKEAEAARNLVEVILHRLHTGQIQVPERVDTGDFIVALGNLKQPLALTARPSRIAAGIETYLAAMKTSLAPSTHALFTLHLNHWRKPLGGADRRPMAAVTHAELDAYIRGRATATSEATADKERRTLLHFFHWAVAQKNLTVNPAAEIPVLKGERDRPPFRTLAEVQAILDRGGLTPAEELDLWECIFLGPAEIAGLLTLVRKQARQEVSYLLHALPAFTGMRRGEVMRLTWTDVDLAGRLVRARSRKQSRKIRETIRAIDLHPDLWTILTDWKNRHPKGQFVVADPANGGPLNNGRANRLFWNPLKGTDWCLDAKKNWFKIGFHTYRHSFVSNLAAAGVDQRVIDEWVGHATDSMRRRYRHLFPSHRRSAIEALRFETAEIGGPSGTTASHRPLLRPRPTSSRSRRPTTASPHSLRTARHPS